MAFERVNKRVQALADEAQAVIAGAMRGDLGDPNAALDIAVEMVDLAAGLVESSPVGTRDWQAADDLGRIGEGLLRIAQVESARRARGEQPQPLPDFEELAISRPWPFPSEADVEARDQEAQRRFDAISGNESSG